MDSDNSAYICRVCGLVCNEPPWGESGKAPSFDYCFCCGVEFGYQDCNIEGIKSFRYEWLRNGAKWDEKAEEPSNWSLEEQMKNIPEKFR